ncbi:glucose-6-phosphate dehydrogenase assembly protein OpcA [Microbacterium endophyticum]|uniref:Glucose-6-phosphate dehydrogenase assembly protein OpcA n=1 Tax=Microbacterium endophyticum TaxID=1526412 RepID=A0A7W4V4L4_9MICO|nr:glucose-6-phosphate dehydrogenase assembly protein OpcA [Microbacterium endophyticum]MBB2976768.1 glucose-6-phosphate dehydrogenase assembly protein OpcA [Microbacterium endophyticum]NIK36595.1 glucose-6-phosphate dehydrogenase assembly protein OpcA [Microbacterium endophyticum]
MIVDMPDTNVSKITRALVSVREEGGAVALGRVLTLIIVTRHGAEEEVIEAANDASREHPMRVIVLMIGESDEEPRLDAQIRVGGDAGASEVVLLSAHGATGSNAESLVTGLLLPDAPVVAWWPTQTPDQPSRSSIGKIAQRRITDAATQPDPSAWVGALGAHYSPGDTDFAWTRITRWREQLAAVLDQPPFEPVTEVEVLGAADSPSTPLLAAWLRLKLDVPVVWRYLPTDEWASGIKSVRLTRESGDTLLERPDAVTAVLTQPGQPSHDLAFPRRTLRECLAEELRSLDPDILYGRVITDGWDLLSTPPTEE